MTQPLPATDTKRDLFCRAIASISPEAIRRARIRAAIHASGLERFREPDADRGAFRVDSIAIGEAVTVEGVYWSEWGALTDGDERTLTTPFNVPEDLCYPDWWGDSLYSAAWNDISGRIDCVFLRAKPEPATIEWEE